MREILIGKKIAVGAAICLAVFVTTAGSERLVYNTYYPAPYGAYKRIRITDNTYLATNGSAVVVVGTRIVTGTAYKKLHVVGKIMSNAAITDADSDDTAVTKEYYDSLRANRLYDVPYTELRRHHVSCTDYSQADDMVCSAACRRYCSNACNGSSGANACGGGISPLRWGGGTRISGTAATVKCVCWVGS